MILGSASGRPRVRSFCAISNSIKRPTSSAVRLVLTPGGTMISGPGLPQADTMITIAITASAMPFTVTTSLAPSRTERVILCGPRPS
jgi:hypothetical protein